MVGRQTTSNANFDDGRLRPGQDDSAGEAVNASSGAAVIQQRPKSRRRRQVEAAEESEEWVISYMDMVTLIMCAFVVIAALLDVQSSHIVGPTLGATDVTVAGPRVQIAPLLVPIPNGGEGVASEPQPAQPPSETDDAGDQPGAAQAGAAAGALPAQSAAIADEHEQPAGAASTTSEAAAGTKPVASAPASDSANDAKVEAAWRSAIAAQGLEGRVAISAKGRTVVMQIQDDILFPTGDSDLVGGGRDILRRIAPLLGQTGGDIRVEGHTDNIPINNERFGSNWELSSARATTVVRALIDAGIVPGRLRATGYADTKPVQPNDTESGRAHNRRVSLIIEQ